MLTFLAWPGIEPTAGQFNPLSHRDRSSCQNLTEVRAFVALASYYQRHIRSFADIACPLHELTKKNIRFYWVQARAGFCYPEGRPECSRIGHANRRGDYVLHTEVNNYSMGCVLQ